MAATVEGAFKLIDKASGTLERIEKRANKVSAALTTAGQRLDAFGKKMEKATGKADVLIERLDSLSHKKATPKIELQGAGQAIAQAKAVDAALDSVDRKAKARGTKGGLIGRFFGALPTGGSSNVESTFGALERGATKLTNKMRPLGMVIGGVAGGVIGLATAFGPLTLVFAAAIPLVFSLVGALTALVSVLALAAGGAALAGGGLMAAFAVGLGSVFAVVKTSLAPMKDYTKATQALTKAMSSGDPRKIQQAQQAVDQLAKANPGIAKLARETQGFKDQFKEIVKPERVKLFGFLARAVGTGRSALGRFGKDIQHNFEAALRAGDHLLKVFAGKTWTANIHSFSRIFQRTIGPITRGIERFARGFGVLVRKSAPDIERLAHGFSRVSTNFLKWAESKRGTKGVRDMFKDLRSVNRLLGATGRLLGALFGASAPSGRGAVNDLTKTFDRWTKWLNDPKHAKAVHQFFHDAVDQTEKLAGFLAKIVDLLGHFSKLTHGIVDFLLKHPDILAVLGGGFLAGKVGGGIFKGVKSGKGIFDTLTGRGRGPSGTERDPLYVRMAGSGPGKKSPRTGAPPVSERGPGTPGREDPGTSRPRGFARAATGAPLRTASGIAAVGAGFAGMHSARRGLGNQANAFAHGADPTNVLHLVGLPSLSDLLPAVKRRIKITPQNIHALFGTTPIGTPGSPRRRAAIAGLPTNPRASGVSQTPRGVPNAGRGILGVQAGSGGSGIPVHQIKKDTKDGGDALTGFGKKTNGVSKQAQKDLAALSKSFGDNLQTIKASTARAFPAIFNEMRTYLVRINTGQNVGNPHIPIDKKAGGGRIGGVGLHDTVPVNNNTLAAPGELVVNRHTERKVNNLLTPHGTTLGGMVGMETRPHHKAALGRRQDSGATRGGLHPGISRAVSSVLGHFPGLVVTSTTGGTHAPGSYHYKGEAADIAGSPALMNRAASWIKSAMGRNLTEGIHNPNLSVKFGKNVAPGFWGASTWAGHADHIHLAVAGMLGELAGLGGGGVPKLRKRKVAGHGLGQQIGQAAVNRVRGRGQAKLRAAAAALGDMGGAGDQTTAGGTYSKGMLKSLWVRAGGDPSVANLAAAIALAESGGRPGIVNSIGATGLWQIYNGHGQVAGARNPFTNARMAVGKYNAAHGFSPWEAYTNGNYRQFLNTGGRIPNGQPPAFGGWFGNGGSITAHKPTYIGIGERGTETATIVKGGKGRGGIHVEHLEVHGGDNVKHEVMAAFRDLARELDLQGPEDGD